MTWSIWMLLIVACTVLPLVLLFVVSVTAQWITRRTPPPATARRRRTKQNSKIALRVLKDRLAA